MSHVMQIVCTAAGCAVLHLCAQTVLQKLPAVLHSNRAGHIAGRTPCPILFSLVFTYFLQEDRLLLSGKLCAEVRRLGGRQGEQLLAPHRFHGFGNLIRHFCRRSAVSP